MKEKITQFIPKLMVTAMMLLVVESYAQIVSLGFARCTNGSSPEINVQPWVFTSAGSFIYQVDVIISSPSGSGIDLGSGKLVINYNPDAFGEYIAANNRLIVKVDDNARNYRTFVLYDKNQNFVYGNVSIADESESKLSISFDQVRTINGVYPSPNVPNEGRVLCRLRFIYKNPLVDPKLSFDADTQFFKAYGRGNPPGLTFSGYNFDSSGGYFYSNTWTGATDSDWSKASNWTGGVPGSNDEYVNVPEVDNPVVIGPTTDLIVNRHLTSEGPDAFIIEDGGTIRTGGRIAGGITYKKNVDFASAVTDGWYLLSSPVLETFDDTFVSDNGIAHGSNNNNNRAVGTYQTPTSSWDYLQSGESIDAVPGQGYSMKRKEDDGTVDFKGTVNNGTYTFSIDNTNLRYNLLGNPYTTYMSSYNFLTNNNNLESSLWMWDPLDKNFDTYILADAPILAPGQGFFVQGSDASDDDDVVFNNQMKTIRPENTESTGRTSNNRPEVHLKFTDGKNERFSKIYYIEGTTTGFDYGYDGERFNSDRNRVDIYTHLVTDSEGKNYQIQSLPNSNYEDMVIPVGVFVSENAGKDYQSGGGTFEFSADVFNLPADYKVFLEDRDYGEFTRLDETDATYRVDYENDIDGIGRFYIHVTTSNVLSSSSENLNTISAYLSSNDNLRITGIQSGRTQVQLYDIVGRQVVNIEITSSGVDNITLPKLGTGVYILNINSEQGNMNKKLMIE